MAGIITKPKPMPRTSRAIAANRRSWCGRRAWCRPGSPRVTTTSRPARLSRTERSASLPASGMTRAAPMPCGAISSPAASADWPRTTW